MASVGYIAGVRDDAQKKLRGLLPKLAEYYGKDAVKLVEDRDRDYEQAHQLQQLANFLEQLLPPEPVAAPEPIEEETQDAPPVKASKKK